MSRRDERSEHHTKKIAKITANRALINSTVDDDDAAREGGADDTYCIEKDRVAGMALENVCDCESINDGDCDDE